MNQRFLIAWIVVFIAWMLGDFVVHGALLGNDYAGLPHLFRPEADSQRYFPWMLLAHVILAGAFVWIYSRGVESRPWPAQGARFGLAVALLIVVPIYLIYYVVQPMPGALVAKQIIYATILLVLLGILVAYLYRIQSRVVSRQI